MKAKDRIDTFLRLAEFRQSRRDVRHQTILRVSVGLWAVLALTIYYLKPRPPEWIVVSALCITFLVHLILARQMQLSNWVDMNTAFYYIETAEKILLGKGDVRPRPKQVHKMSLREQWIVPLDNNIFAQGFWLAPTIVLTLVAYFLIGG